MASSPSGTRASDRHTALGRLATWWRGRQDAARRAAANALADGLWYPQEELPASVLWGVRLDPHRFQEDRGLVRRRPGA